MFRSTKTYGHDLGLSCAFRQWRAQGHCHFVHGYALAIHLEFEADTLDDKNWVVDFGSLKTFKAQLVDTFDHKLLVAEDDPERPLLQSLSERGVADVVVVPATGCEQFARMVYQAADAWLGDNGYKPRCRVARVEVREHGANSAIYAQRA